MDHAPDMPKRKRNRLMHYDYSQNGLYFITICAADENVLFTRLTAVDDLARPYRSELTPLGSIADDAINAVPLHYDGVSIDKYVIMPDHMHLILRIETRPDRFAPSAATVIGSLKRAVSRRYGSSVWQKGFYDHVIRNKDDYLQTWQYIDANPMKWLEKHSITPGL